MKASDKASAFLAACREHGFTPVVKSTGVVAVSKRFTPGDKDAFVACDMLAGGVLEHLGARGGSQWGTDGGSIGGASALSSGLFVLNQSGDNLTLVVKALRKLTVAR